MIELSKAFRSLPWYLIGSILLVPLVAAPFTAGASLFLYVAPFTRQLWGGPSWQMPTYMGIVLGPGLLVWLFRQFIRAAWYTYWRNRAY